MCCSELLDPQLPTQCCPEVDIFRLESRRVGVSNVVGQHLHPPRFQLQSISVNSKKFVQHVAKPMNEYFDSVGSRKRANTHRLLFFMVYFNFRVGNPANAKSMRQRYAGGWPKGYWSYSAHVATTRALLAQYSYQRSRRRRSSPQFRSLMIWLQLGTLALVSLNAAASRDQAVIKQEVTVQPECSCGRLPDRSVDSKSDWRTGGWSFQTVRDPLQ